MKLKDFDFNTLKRPRLTNLAVRIKGDKKWYEESTIGETLKSLPEEFANMEIEETRWFFDTFVIELKKKGTESMTQIKFIDKESQETHGGILTDDGDVICGCCGSVIHRDDVPYDIEIVEKYSTWIPLDHEITLDHKFFGD